MEKEQIYEEIAKKLSAKVRKGDDVVIKTNYFGVQVKVCKQSMICNYLLREIYIISEEYDSEIYVASDTSGNPYVMIH